MTPRARPDAGFIRGRRLGLAKAMTGERKTLDELASATDSLPLVAANRVGPLLAGHASRLAISGAAVDAWRRSLIHATARRLALNHALEQVGAILDAAHIPWLPIKGMGLPPGTYERLEERPTTDLDVLIRPADLDRAVGVLRKAGWKDAHPDPLSWRFLKEEGYNWQAVGPSPVILELHFRLWGSVPETFVVDLFDRSRPDPARGSFARTIDPADAAILAAVHYWQTPTPRPLLFLWDLERLAAVVLTETQREELVARATDAGLQLYMALSMGLVNALWPSEIAAGLLCELEGVCGRFERRVLSRCSRVEPDRLTLGRIVLARLLDRRPSRTGWMAPVRSVWPHPGTLASQFPTTSSRAVRRVRHFARLVRDPSILNRRGGF